MRMRQIAVLAAALVGWSGAADADQAADPKALARAQFMLRQMSSELEAARAESTRLKAELESLKAKKSSADGALAKSKGLVEDLQAKLDQTLAEKQRIDEVAADRGRQLDQCTAKNVKMYDLNVELLKRYANKGVIDVMVTREPLTGLKKVEMENQVQDLQDKLDEQRLSSGQNPDVASEHTP